MRRTTRKATKRIIHVFVPRPENGYHPHALRQITVFLVLAGLLVSQVGFLAYETILRGAGPNVAAVLPSVIADLTNEARAEAASQPLTISPVLSEAAQKKAEDMVSKGYFAHQEPNGEMPWHLFREAGYEYVYAGENLAVNFTDTRQLVDAWLASPTHRSNIVKPNYTDIGIGMATGTYKGREAVFVVQFFGARKGNENLDFVHQNIEEREVAGATSSAAVAVLGEETSNVKNSVSLWQKIKLSPRTFNIQMLAVFMAVFGSILAICLVPSFRTHPRAILNGLLVVAIIASLYGFQKGFLGDVEVPDGSQAAAASMVL